MQIKVFGGIGSLEGEPMIWKNRNASPIGDSIYRAVCVKLSILESHLFRSLYNKYLLMNKLFFFWNVSVLLYYYPETVYPPVVYFKIKVFLNN
jgi:hypothetical protein